MWGVSENPESQLKTAIEFTGDHEKYGQAMSRVIHEWKYSCEQNLTDLGMNRRAWIGHAAVCLELGIPEHITRKAWSYLSFEQQRLANAQADRNIYLWEQKRKSLDGLSNGSDKVTKPEYQTKLPMNWNETTLSHLIVESVGQ